MKNKKIIILLIVIDIIIMTIICNFINKNIIKDKQIIKEMSESIQVEELNSQINALNAEHTEYMNYIQTGKTKIATALTNEGVPTSNEATLETMADNISNVLQARTSDATATADNITEGKTAYVNGELITGTGADNNYYYDQGSNMSGSVKIINLGQNTTFDLTGYEGFQNFSIDDFIITGEISKSISATGGYDSGGNPLRNQGSASISFVKSYDSNTGILTAYSVLSFNANVHYLSGSNAYYISNNVKIPVEASLIMQ